MPSIGQENLETVMIDFFGALRRGDFEAAAGLLDPDVSWQGLREEWVCHGREEVIDTFRWGLERRREIDALEFTRGGEQVVLGARGPSIGPAEEPLDQIFNVFTLRDGRIVRIDDYRGRREALSRLKRFGCRQRGLSIAAIVAVDRCARARFQPRARSGMKCCSSPLVLSIMSLPEASTPLGSFRQREILPKAR